MIEDFLDWLSPTTKKPLSDFNSQEKQREQFGVIPIDITCMDGELDHLLAGSGINTLDAKFNDIDKYLAATQAEYKDYVVSVVATDEKHVEKPQYNYQREKIGQAGDRTRDSPFSCKSPNAPIPDALHASCQAPWPSNLPAPSTIFLAPQGGAPCNT